jgi:hypothetical protein
MRSPWARVHECDTRPRGLTPGLFDGKLSLPLHGADRSVQVRAEQILHAEVARKDQEALILRVPGLLLVASAVRSEPVLHHSPVDGDILQSLQGLAADGETVLGGVSHGIEPVVTLAPRRVQVDELDVGTLVRGHLAVRRVLDQVVDAVTGAVDPARQVLNRNEPDVMSERLVCRTSGRQHRGACRHRACSYGRTRYGADVSGRCPRRVNREQWHRDTGAQSCYGCHRYQNETGRLHRTITSIHAAVSEEQPRIISPR